MDAAAAKQEPSDWNGQLKKCVSWGAKRKNAFAQDVVRRQSDFPLDGPPHQSLSTACRWADGFLALNFILSLSTARDSKSPKLSLL